MSDPITRAEALIRANPRERAAYEFGRADGYDSARMTNQSARACGDAAATYLLLAEVEPDPTTLLPRLRHLSTLLAQYDAATTALGYAVSLQDIGEHTAARDAAWAEIVRVWGER
jgi:hypothetical protein